MTPREARRGSLTIFIVVSGRWRIIEQSQSKDREKSELLAF
jgi:hypothetical protein